MKVIVDRDRCEGNMVCMRWCPEVFRLGDDDKVTLLKDTVPDDLRQRVERAVQGCPRQALALQE
jgi:ferredoxin